jgi:hypothetical protein
MDELLAELVAAGLHGDEFDRRPPVGVPILDRRSLPHREVGPPRGEADGPGISHDRVSAATVEGRFGSRADHRPAAPSGRSAGG